MTDLTIKEAKVLIWVLGIACFLFMILLAVEQNDFMGIQLWEESWDTNPDYEFGRAMMFMDLYPSPEILDEAIKNNEIDYSMIPPGVQTMYEWYVEDLKDD